MKQFTRYFKRFLFNSRKFINQFSRPVADIYHKLKQRDFTPKQIVLGMVLATFLWMISGVFKYEKIAEEDNSKVANYKSMKSKAILRNKYLTVNGVLQAKDVVEIYAEVEGKVIELPAKEGSDLSKGEAIIVIDSKNKQELLQQAEATLAQRKIDYNAAKTLSANKLASKETLAEKEAQLYNAEANLKAAQLALANCIVKAPFDGYLDHINVDVGDYISSASTTLGVFLDRTYMHAMVAIPQKYIHDLKQVENAEVIFNDNLSALGKVIFIGQVADEKTKTFALKVEIDNNTLYRANGETVTVRLPYQQKMAHKVPMSVLLLSDDGAIIVKTINKEGMVADNQIEFVEEDSDGVWISGLPEECEIITMGGHFLKSGTRIKL
jgi:multidrug efflux system membrane fusion protein